jgi:hypothetical protein
MEAAIDHIRKKLNLLGWYPKEREIIGPSSEKIWVVFSNHDNRSFSVQGHTQWDAWESAWQLVNRVQNGFGEPRMILPFPSYFAKNRAA